MKAVSCRDSELRSERPNLEKCQILLLKGLNTMTGDRSARGHCARQLSQRLNINKAEPSIYFVTVSRHNCGLVRVMRQVRSPGRPGSPSVIIANKILITQECSVSPCKINPEPGPLSCLDQAEPRATAAHSTEPGPPLSHCVSTVIVKRLRLINHQKRHLLIIN